MKSKYHFVSFIGDMDIFNDPMAIQYPFLPKSILSRIQGQEFNAWTGSFSDYMKICIYGEYPEIINKFITKHWSDLYETTEEQIEFIFRESALSYNDRTICALISAKNINILLSSDEFDSFNFEAYYVKEYTRPIVEINPLITELNPSDELQKNFVYPVNFHFFIIKHDKVIRETKTLYFSYPTLQYAYSSIKYLSGIYTYHQMRTMFGWNIKPVLSNPIEHIRIKNSSKTVQSVEINKAPGIDYLYGILISHYKTTDDPNPNNAIVSAGYTLIIPAHQQKLIITNSIKDLLSSIGYIVKDANTKFPKVLADNFRSYIPDFTTDMLASPELNRLDLVPKVLDEPILVKIYF